MAATINDVSDSQLGPSGSEGGLVAARFVALSPSTVGRWTREGRSFVPLGVAPRIEGDCDDGLGPGSAVETP